MFTMLLLLKKRLTTKLTLVKQMHLKVVTIFLKHQKRSLFARSLHHILYNHPRHDSQLPFTGAYYGTLLHSSYY